MMDLESYENSAITPLGITNWRNLNQPFGIKDKDRLQHIYVIGKSGTGKSTLLESMAISDINRGNGLCLVDPHGDVAESVLNYIPQKRITNVIYLNPADAEYSVAFNPLAAIEPEQRHLAVAGLIATFKKIWADSWGPRMEHILRFALLALLEYGESTLLDIQPLLTNPQFRNKVLERITSPPVLMFWLNEFDRYSPALKAEAVAPILNKMGLFQASAPLRNTVGQKTTAFQMKHVLNDRMILICNLSKGKIGEDASSLLGSMVVNSIQLAALARAGQAIQERTPFYLYVDECHSFISLAFADVMAEARKYGLSLFLAHQYIEQLHEKICSAIFGNVGTFIVFRVGAADAEYLAKEFYQVFNESDLVNLPRYSMYLKLMIDGATSKPFSATTIPLRAFIDSYREEVIAASRRQFACKKEDAEQVLFSPLTDNDSNNHNRMSSLF
jgi:hypothetical protein